MLTTSPAVLQWFPPPPGTYNSLPWSQGLTFGTAPDNTSLSVLTARQGWGCLLFASLSAFIISDTFARPISGGVFNIQIQQPGSSIWQNATTLPYVTAVNRLSVFAPGTVFSNFIWDALFVIPQTSLKWRCTIGVLSARTTTGNFSYVYSTSNTVYLSVIPSQYSMFSANGEPGESRYPRLVSLGYV